MLSNSGGKVALVTGASKGIGQAIAQRLAANGMALAVHYGGDEAGAADTVRRIQAAGGKARALKANVADAAQVDALFAQAMAAFGRLDVVVNNAGIGVPPTPIAELAEADFDRVMATNAKGVFLVMREAAKRLGDDGRIVSIATTLSLTARPGFGVYAASDLREPAPVAAGVPSDALQCLARYRQLSGDPRPDRRARAVPGTGRHRDDRGRRALLRRAAAGGPGHRARLGSPRCCCSMSRSRASRRPSASACRTSSRPSPRTSRC